MRAVWLRKFGGPEVLLAEETPDPVPGEGQALVEVVASGITYVETLVRSGSAPMRLPPLPIIPGNGVTLVPMGAAFPSAAAMQELSVQALADGAVGRLRPAIGQTFPLERVADAHAAIGARTALGKTLLIT
ncbi:zinc-binding dehydrogenase [Nonomuraea sp. NPDC049152]|uniref:zinc-binding dehydrogenase n=1 Tax=Nonomuraea sp. NPDC049152 TaxID=3154350 RepID=UPI0033DC8C38